MKYRVLHRTTYRYSEPVSISLNQSCLRPRDFAHQRCAVHTLSITPEPTSRDVHSDYFGNLHTIFSLGIPHREMTVEAQSQVTVEARTTPDPETTAPWETVRDQLATSLEAAPYLPASSMIRPAPAFADYAAPSFPVGRPILAALLDLTRRIKTEFTYDPAATSLATTSTEVLEKRRGVCQDFAQLQAACLRSLGLPARYVSGYLLTRPPPGKPKLIGADASHCWVSVFIPSLGWIDVDPTNGCLVDDEHITIAWGRDYRDITPLKGLILGGGTQTIQVAVDVDPL